MPRFCVRSLPASAAPRRDVVLLNAAAVLITSGTVPDSADTGVAFRAAIALAAAAIDSGEVTRLVASLSSERG